jgi:hypothetical protein
MSKGTLFEYCVLHHPTPKKDQGGNDITEKSTVIVKPDTLVAVDQKEAITKVGRMIPKEYDDKIHECDILVRPF